MLLASILSSLPTLRLPHSYQERLNLALGTAAFLGTTTLLPAAYRDYRTFKSYGQGGVPNNVIGWLIVRLLFQPFRGEMLDTEVYSRRIDAAEGHGMGGDGYLTLSKEQLATRSPDTRPEVGPHVAPQRQLTQIPDEDIMEVCESRYLFSFEFSNIWIWGLPYPWVTPDLLNCLSGGQ